MVVDAAVHPSISTEEYLRRLPGPWRDHNMGLPTPLGRLWETPIDEVADLAAAGDPERVAEAVFGAGDVDAAILTPLTRGILPNRLHATAVAAATNDWLAEAFLDGSADERFYGSIRVAVTDVEGAVREIERWAGNPRFVQVAVGLRAFAHFGEEQYLPIWEAAAAHGLPVYVQDDLANAAEMWHSVAGQPVHWAEADTLRALTAIVQMASVMGSGLYERLPDLRFIFGDGGLDLAPTLLWRLNNDWRAGRVEVPWIEELPSTLVQRYARFVCSYTDGRPDGETLDPELVAVTRPGTLAIYGSHHPHWDGATRAEATEGLGDEDAARVLAGNALETIPRLAAALGVEVAA
ncbi:MAG TPA: amidohydrolase family protein [Baekduia sp.]|uniref:amidohydrolase family protein n=1 Tax=Baekduia sp. TaxID=2600305 RepID=UPI002D78553B|nr:amidohydrolase family protein [Baekduia sp.]HET6509947.1 amidohydrolase family protein [Baekduia sp.]